MPTGPNPSHGRQALVEPIENLERVIADLERLAPGTEGDFERRLPGATRAEKIARLRDAATAARSLLT